jgi:hypothetical protein
MVYRRPSLALVAPRGIAGLFVLFGLLAGSAPAHAWGDLGHKIICEIAYQELNDKAHAEVDRLISLDTFPVVPRVLCLAGPSPEAG